MGNPTTAYVVYVTCGEYSDWTMDNLCVFTDELKAKHAMEIYKDLLQAGDISEYYNPEVHMEEMPLNSGRFSEHLKSFTI